MNTTLVTYRMRFPEHEHASRKLLWQTLCHSFFKRLIKPSDAVMDIGAGYCEFINAIPCHKKYAVDINPDTRKFAAHSVTVLATTATKIPSRYNHMMDVVFMSNFLEHLETKQDVFTVLTRINKLLARDGRLIILQPNMDLTHGHYWDFFDHNVIFNTENIREVLGLCGFHIDSFIVRFLPYTTKNTFLPGIPIFIKLYLSLPEFLRPWAGQSLIVAHTAPRES